MSNTKVGYTGGRTLHVEMSSCMVGRRLVSVSALLVRSEPRSGLLEGRAALVKNSQCGALNHSGEIELQLAPKRCWELEGLRHDVGDGVKRTSVQMILWEFLPQLVCARASDIKHTSCEQ